MTAGRAIIMVIFGAVLFIFGLLHALVLLNDPGPPATPLYQPGEMVTSVLTGETGQVIKTHCYAIPVCMYVVRFKGDQYSTNTPFLGGTRPIEHEPMSVVLMREFELR